MDIISPVSTLVGGVPAAAPLSNDTLGVNEMADQPIVVPVQGTQNDGFGGGTSGAMLATLMMTTLLRNGGLGAADAISHKNDNQDVLQAMNQQQLASATQIMTQDINRTGHDIATSAAATQATVANSTLQQTVATLSGQNAITGAVADSTIQNLNSHTGILQAVSSGNASTAAQINNAAAGISSEITNALGVLDTDLHGMSAQIDNSIARARDDVNRAHRDQIDATHRAEIQGMRSSFDILKEIQSSTHETFKAIKSDGDLTRNQMWQNAIADRDRMIIVAENKLAEALADHRHTRSTNDIIINNNNNNNLLAQTLASNTMQQQISALTNGQSALTNGLNAIANHLTNITQVSVNSTPTNGSSNRS